MTNLTSKIVLPIVFSSIFALNSTGSKAQVRDSLTSNLVNSYDSLKKDLLLSFQRYSKIEGSIKADYYDIDGDGKVDVKEVFLSTAGNELNNRPGMYIFDTNKDGNFSEYLDVLEDGLNGNEIYLKPEEEFIDTKIQNL